MNQAVAGQPTRTISNILTDSAVRREVCRNSHSWFFNIYLSHYVKVPTANFQKEIFAITEDEMIGMAVIMAFRDSAKSTIVAISYPIWAILGKQQKKCIVILSQTQSQAKIHLRNIRCELESNDLLKMDLGPFREESSEWGSFSIVIPRFDARIVIASSEQSIRGLIHKSYRPDLIICDDIEDLESVTTKEKRDKTYNWLTGDIIPLGGLGAKIIVIGNMLHEDSTLMRLKKGIEEGSRSGVFKFYPLVDEHNNILWPGKFPSMDSVNQLRDHMGNPVSWEREYMLRIIENASSPIKSEWIRHYDKLPDIHHPDYRYSAIGTDFAFKQGDKNDNTAMIMARVFEHNGEKTIYILPNIVNGQLNPQEIRDRLKILADSANDGRRTFIFIEDVGGQNIYAYDLRQSGYQAEEVKVYGKKYDRLAVIAHMVQTGKVMFPEKGCEELEGQLKYFGAGRYDDLADAFSLLVSSIITKKFLEPKITWI